MEGKGKMLTFEERKFVLKSYWKCRNMSEIQKKFMKTFKTDKAPSRLTIIRIRDKFETYGTIQNIHKERSGRRKTSTNSVMEELVMQAHHKNPKQSVRHLARELGISRSSVHRILLTNKKKPGVKLENAENVTERSAAESTTENHQSTQTMPVPRQNMQQIVQPIVPLLNHQLSQSLTSPNHHLTSASSIKEENHQLTPTPSLNDQNHQLTPISSITIQNHQLIPVSSINAIN